jgi:PAS domain S-box-containing protein
MSEIDVSACELEPIRFPGAVQPDGVLLVLQAASGIIEAASETCESLLGWRAEKLLGLPLGRILGDDSQATLLTVPTDGPPPVVDFSINGNELCARSYVNGAGQVLIDIETVKRDSVLLRTLIHTWHQNLSRLREPGEISLIVQDALKLIGEITGFDRVMLYRFDEAWNGEVIGEACRENIAAYLGHHFPASDIPKQARELFRLGRVRQIADALYRPSALIARGDSRTIDLGPSSLRSVSPIHLEYLANMGVRATLTGALTVDGRLWGLLACHHIGGPKYLSPAERDAFGWICEDIASMIGVALNKQRGERRSVLRTHRRQLLDEIRAASFDEYIRQGNSANLLRVLDADGFALIAADSIQTYGSTPAAERILEMQRRRRAHAADSDLFVSNALNHDLGLGKAADGVAGAIFVSLLERPDVNMIWFRNERASAVRWAGDPDRAHFVNDSGRVSPRRSFAAFTQNVRGQCLKWAPEEVDSAYEMRSLIESEIKRSAESALIKSRAQLKTFIEMSTAGNAMLDRDLNFLAVSRRWRGEFGRSGENPAGRNLYQELPGVSAEWKSIHRQVLAGATVNNDEEMWIHADGSQRWFRWVATPWSDESGEIGGVVLSCEDLTGRKEAEAARISLEAQLRESQKMESIGKLAGGIAHDFNNIVATILGNAELAFADVRNDPAAAQAGIEEIRKAGRRARDLVRQILTFSRRQATERKNMELAPVIDESVRMLRAIIPARISLAYECEADIPEVLADAIQIQQIVLNLVTNSLQAMSGKGRILIRLDTATLDTALANTAPQLRALHERQPGRMVRVAVSDTGTGMDAATLERMFEPFFTTKPAGEGTGLGLSVVYGIVQAHEGAVTVDSMPGKGTTLTVYLPIAEGASAMPAVEASAAATSAKQNPNLHILYLDDDEALAHLVKRLLERRGYRVSEFTNQNAALAALRANPAAFDLVLTDYNMPGMSGLDVAREVSDIRPDLPVAITSGFIDEELQAQAAGAGVRELIFKADAVNVLCDAVQRIVQGLEAKP